MLCALLFAERQLNLVLRIKDVYFAPSDATKTPAWDRRSSSACTYFTGSATKTHETGELLDNFQVR